MKNLDEMPIVALRRELQRHEMDASNLDLPKHIRAEANRRARIMRDYLLIREYNATA
jgi:hypothetical protein